MKLLLLLLLVSPVSAQTLLQTAGEGTPSGFCRDTRYLDLSTGSFWKCQTDNTWALDVPSNNRWRSGSGAPSNSLGLDGDWYYDLVANFTYRRAGGAYTQIVGLQGPQGTPGAPGPATTNASLLTSGTVPFAQGGNAGVAATPATTGVMSVPMTSRVLTITPTGACTFNATGGIAGQQVTFVITTSGVSSFVLTFGTNFRKVGTLATGTTSARTFAVSFVYTGSLWVEVARTAAQT